MSGYVRPVVDYQEKYSYPPKLLDAEGKRLCVGRNCGKRLVGRQERWCSAECTRAALATYDWSAARRATLVRDSFKCTECGDIHSDLEVDHIVPLVEGGKLCDPSNLRTLCRLCHKKYTAALRTRLKLSKAA